MLNEREHDFGEKKIIQLRKKIRGVIYFKTVLHTCLNHIRARLSHYKQEKEREKKKKTEKGEDNWHIKGSELITNYNC
jgi:regulator of replication initiation timing